MLPTSSSPRTRRRPAGCFADRVAGVAARRMPSPASSGSVSRFSPSLSIISRLAEPSPRVAAPLAFLERGMLMVHVVARMCVPLASTGERRPPRRLQLVDAAVQIGEQIVGAPTRSTCVARRQAWAIRAHPAPICAPARRQPRRSSLQYGAIARDSRCRQSCQSRRYRHAAEGQKRTPSGPVTSRGRFLSRSTSTGPYCGRRRADPHARPRPRCRRRGPHRRPSRPAPQVNFLAAVGHRDLLQSNACSLRQPLQLLHMLRQVGPSNGQVPRVREERLRVLHLRHDVKMLRIPANRERT